MTKLNFRAATLVVFVIIVFAMFSVSSFAQSTEDSTAPSTHLLRVSQLPITVKPWTHDITVSDGTAYIRAASGLTVVDVHHPYHPHVIQTVSDDDAKATEKIDSAGRYLYAAAYGGTTHNNSLQVWDVINPVLPYVRGSATMGGTDQGEITHVELAGNYAYVVDFDDVPYGIPGLHIVDIRDPKEPEEIGSIIIDGITTRALDVALMGPYALVAAYGGGLVVVDVWDPTDPKRIAEFGEVGQDGQYINDVATDGEYAFIGGYQSGTNWIKAIELSVPSQPREVGSHVLSQRVRDMAYADGYLYVVGESVQVIDVSEPHHPWIVETHSTAGTIYNVTVDGDQLYILDDTEGLIIYQRPISTPTLYTQISVNSGHSCALKSSGKVDCWGANRSGQIGNGETRGASVATPVRDITNAIAVSTGNSHSCALTANGYVRCWGSDSSGQLGNGDDSRYLPHTAPVFARGIDDAIAIATGNNHSCALSAAGDAQCWGYNYRGQLGNGTNESSRVPVDVLGLSGRASDIAAGQEHTCALMEGGHVKCWGSNYKGQLGNGSNEHQSLPVTVNGLTNVKSIAARGLQTCAIRGDGSLWCWGHNWRGQLGDGSTSDRNTPVRVQDISSVAMVAVGTYHTCAITTSNASSCWGFNTAGQYGDGSVIESTTPSPAGSGITFSSISAGWRHTCGITINGRLLCWGSNRDGQLGDGTRVQREIPIDIWYLADGFSEVDGGEGHTCTLVGNGRVFCWGRNFAGQLGDGTNMHRSTPREVVGLGEVRTLVTGLFHSCAAPDSGGVMCWGLNPMGQLGDGTTEDRYTPVSVQHLSEQVIDLAAGHAHTCALTDSGNIKCWGLGFHGQIGNGENEYRVLTPVDVVELNQRAVAITAGYYHTCALLETGGVKCWGFNDIGRLGDGTQIWRNTPVDVVGLAQGVVAVDGDYGHSCAVMQNGTIRCWGWNSYGQLGNGGYRNSWQPVTAVGLNGQAIDVKVGQNHSCALLAGGEVQCWGHNYYGQVGEGSGVDQRQPTPVTGLGSGVTAIAAGDEHNCAIIANHRLKCWGRDGEGQLGIGTPAWRLRPEPISESAVPTLSLNYRSGRQGSVFTVIGQGFPPERFATVTINGHILSNDLLVNPTGGFIFYLDTSDAGEGRYTVNASVNPSAVASFQLSNDAPVRPIEGAGDAYQVPSGIGNETIFLPRIDS